MAAWFPDSGADACELLFDDYRVVNDKSVPHSIITRREGKVLAEWRLVDLKW